ncbi:MAG: hypothetical protein P8Y99_03455 [Calditrichaceae bacterium]
MAEDQNLILNSGNDSILFAHKAFKFLENQLYDDALAICEEGVKHFPFYAEGHFILGKCYQTLKKYDDAKNEYERTLVFMPGHIRALNALAFIYYKMDLAPKANDLLIQASLYNPYNKDLIGYLKTENLYDSIYTSDTTIPSADDTTINTDNVSETSELEIDIEDDVTRELISEINDLNTESEQDELAEVSSEKWQEGSEQIAADELVSYDVSENKLDDSTLNFEDSEVADFDREADDEMREEFPDEIESNLDMGEGSDESMNMIESELNDITEDDIQDAGSENFNIEDSAIDDSFLDDSFISDNADNEFYLESDESDEKNADEDEEITRIDEYASSKDENTELSIEQYEVNNIVNNIVEADNKEDSKTDLSKFANTEDDFSSLMNGIFEEREPEENEEELSEDNLEQFDEDETQLAEERPILDTSIIFMDREDQESEASEESLEEAETQLSDLDDDIDIQDTDIDLGSDEDEDIILDEDEEDIQLGYVSEQEGSLEDFNDEDDDISKMIEEIEKKGDNLISQDETENDITELSDQPRVESLPVIDDENANIDDILNNPKMLTPTFGEILIAQKKFGDAQRVFKELQKKP